MNKAILYVHGKGGSFREAEPFRKSCSGYDIIGVDYEVDAPWVVKGILQSAYEKAARCYTSVSVLANSIGAFFTMDALGHCAPEKALFISPIVDMEKLICDMMSWAGVTEDQLVREQEIATDFGETLSWEYLQYVRNNPVQWRVPTEILYAARDHLTSRETIDYFVKTHHARMTVMEDGEHWFHTEEQIAVLDAWMKQALI